MVREFSAGAVHSGLIKSSMDTSNVSFENLLDHNAAKRVEILIVMRKLLKNGNGYLPFQNTSLESVFTVLFHVLDDSRWEVRYQCLLLVCGIIPNISEELDSCMSLVLPKIISNLGHDNVNVRRAALQSLHIFMKHTNNLQNFQKVFIHCGLENPEFIVRKGCIMSIGILFANGFENENLFPLIECLSKQFVEGDASLFYPIFLAMQKLHELLGSATFDQYLQNLDEEAANTYMRVLNKFSLHGSRMSSSSGSHSSFSNINGFCGGGNKLLKYDFGIFQPYITEKIKSDDWKTRVEAIEHMKMIISDVPDFSEKISDMDEYMVFLSRLLEDSNFKIVIQALSVYDLLIDKFKNQMKRFLKTFVTSVLKRLGDTKLVVREHAIRVIHKLMHHVKPTEVLGHLLHHKDSRNQRLREEIVNRVTAAVLTFPSYNFEFLPLCEFVAPLLTDTKRRVRLAALECFAALAQAMGPTRLIPLVSAVDDVEINSDAEGLLAAVQARLARRILPRCTEDGAVSYAIILPSSAGSQSRNVSPWGPDIEWIMAASSSSSSSTPPSRSKEICVTDLDQNGESAAFKVVDIKEPRNEELVNVFKRDNNWLKNTPYDTTSSSTTYHTENELVREQNRRLNIEAKDYKVKPIIASNPDKSVQMLIDGSPGETKSYQNEASKMRPVIVNSKIPVLARSSGKRITVEETPTTRAPTLRALSAQRHNTLPSFSARHSALHRRASTHISQENKVPNITQQEKYSDETVLRKISPAATPTGRQPILVRSPSLSSLGQLPSDVGTGNHILYGAYSPPYKNMGNIGSYFRQSPGGVVVAQPTPVHLDDVNVFDVALLDGSGKLPVNTSNDSWEILHSNVNNNNSSSENWEKTMEGMPEVYEMHMETPASYGRKIVTSPLNIVDNGNISIAKITREKMLKRQQEIMKEAEERRLNKEREQKIIEQKMQEQESKHASDDNNAPPEVITNNLDIHTMDNQAIETVVCSCNESTVMLKPESPIDTIQVPSKPTPVPQQNKRIDSARNKGSAKPLSRSSSLKTPGSLRRLTQSQPIPSKNSQTLKHNMAASSLALFDESADEVVAYPNPNEALKKALKSLSTDTWMGKIEGIRTIQRLSKCHPEIVQVQLHPVVLALLTEVKNLRSSVARAAILAMGDLFIYLKRNVEPDLDLITSTLLSKCGETVGFIRDDIEKVMNHLIETITPCKAALSIIAGGASHRNGAVRKVAAQSLLAVVEKMGAARILTSYKDVTERLLPTTAQFLMDGTPLTRYYGRRIFHLLMQHPVFDKLLLRYVQPSTLRNINSILDSLRKKGPGELPKEGVSAKTLKSESYRNAHLNRTM